MTTRSNPPLQGTLSSLPGLSCAARQGMTSRRAGVGEACCRPLAGETVEYGEAAGHLRDVVKHIGQKLGFNDIEHLETGDEVEASLGPGCERFNGRIVALDRREKPRPNFSDEPPLPQP
jgi:hypothetical protein